MAVAITGFFADYYKESARPVFTIVEPNNVKCFYKTVQAKDGTLHTVKGY